MSTPTERILTPMVLAGAGRFSSEVAEIASAAGFAVVGRIEGMDPGAVSPNSMPPIVWVDEQAAFMPDAVLAPAIGSVQRRKLMDRLVAEGRELASVIHPAALISESAHIEPGCVISPGVIIGAHAWIGRCTILHRAALIGHHTTIGAHSFLGPGANVAGSIVIGAQVMIAMGAIVRDHLSVGDGAVVGAGAVAVKDVLAGSTVVGVPARPLSR
jgi:sugar O-acyltransferase (sialic acid O-acetyltransferase NeuD family)